MFSLDAFAELPPGTKFVVALQNGDVEPFLKLQPWFGDIGNCNVVSLISGKIYHAYDLWDMRQFKADLDISDIASFDPNFDQTVEIFDWEKDLLFNPETDKVDYFAIQRKHPDEDPEIQEANDAFFEAEEGVFVSGFFTIAYDCFSQETLEAMEELGIDLPSCYDEDEEQRLYEDFRRRMDDNQNN